MSAITSIKTNIYPFVQAMVVTTLSEIALGGTRGPFVRRKIRALTTLTPPGLIAIQRIWSLASLNIITMLFLSQGSASLFSHATNHPLLVLLPIVRTVVEYAPFNVQGKIDTLIVPKVFSDLSKRMAYLFAQLRSRLCFQGDDDLFANRKKIILIEIYNSVVISPVIEELFFRGVVQEFFLRQLPKFALRLLTMNTELVDVPAFKILRIVISAGFFGVAHSWKNGPATILKTTLLGLDTAYRHESTGLSAAILSHFNNNLYVTIGSITHT